VVALAQAGHDPADLLVVARVIGPWPGIEFAAAAAEMRHDEGEAVFAGEIGKSLGIVAA